MTSLFRKKLVCFCCGYKSGQRYESGLRQWYCRNCEADNFLDENGEISDPPESLIAASAPYTARQTPSSSEDPTSFKGESIFCATCQKNQHLYTQSLAEFYPSIDQSDFSEYTKAEQEYRESLEDRYPQICADCEPRALKQLKDANHAAKADHLGRLIERTRNRGIVRRSGEWKRWLVMLGGIAWLSSILGLLLWNGLGLLTTDDEVPWLDQEGLSVSSASACYRIFLFSLEAPRSCSLLANETARFALIVGLLSLWWHPRLQEKLERKQGRVCGLAEYYKIQITSLIVRGALWYWSSTSSQSADSGKLRGVHFFSGMLTVLSAFISYRTVTIDYTPKVSFKESPESLLSRRQRENMQANQQRIPSQDARITKTPASFSINLLNPPTPQTIPRQQETPPSEDDMDWTPTKTTSHIGPPPAPSTNSFPPLEPLRPAHIRRTQPPPPNPDHKSPFHGRLPTNILTPAQKLRNPPNQTVFRSRNPGLNTFPPIKSISTSYDQENSPLDSSSPSPTHINNLSLNGWGGNSEMAKPKFFPPADRQDTGLEDIFSQTLSVGQTPAEVRRSREREEELTRRRRGDEAVRSVLDWYRGLAGFALVGVGVVAVVSLLWSVRMQSLPPVV